MIISSVIIFTIACPLFASRKRDSEVNSSRGILDLIKEADLDEKSEKKPKLVSIAT